ncbi:MAG: hypothetical protein KH452_13570 [Clostridiales bacterium]|nr:hypothetical protein [Clostridiales bacterium]
MNKKFMVILLLLGVLTTMTFAGFGIWHSTSTASTFETGGYILQGEEEELKWIAFQAEEAYSPNLSGTISFDSTEDGRISVPRESFVHYDNGNVMAFSDGVLLDFNDLSENFINNYYISAGLPIMEAGDGYTAETETGSLKFGEHLWKLSDRKYMVESPTLSVHFSEDDVREVSRYVQVVVTEDQVVHLLTPENLWMTISENCYIETAGGVKIYPVSQLIDNGSYKLSLAKLSVSTDDSIVLTADETRRQIVPELNIEAIDGEDGEDGEDGQAGQTGKAGEAGVDGTDGEDGADGETGADGSDGQSGSSGSAGANGSGGDGGKNGGTGSSGKDAVVESTTNSALPTMTITDWQVSATGLKGCITVTDSAGFLQAVEDYNKYPGQVTITKVSTGEVVYCYQVEDNYSLDSVEPSNHSFDHFYQREEVYFSTLKDVLEADTEYRLSVTAYYKTNDPANLVYSREFISRSFYTDSTGAMLAYKEAETDKITFSASVSSSYSGSIASAKVYLLTPEQNKSFSAASMGDAGNYTAVQDVNFNGGLSADVTFDGLTHNTRYIARIYVETTEGLQSLTRQELEAMTLKETPTTESADVPRASYNRLTGAFEVWRPVVTDPDGGAVSYTYTAYRLNSEGKWEEDSVRTITASEGEPVEFRLSSGETYKFGVEMKFHDNEKVVYYDLKESETIQSEGDTMPRITLTPETAGAEYNKYNGKLTISLGAKSSIEEVSPNTPMRLEIYADQIQDSSVELTAEGTPVNVSGGDTKTLGSVTLNPMTNTNEVTLLLALDNLYKNTNYSITVYGYLDLGDGNGSSNRAIGTVSFRTYDTVTLNASWQTPADISTAFARTLRLEVKDSTAADDRKNYAADELKSGQVTVDLYSGTGTGKLQIAQKNFNTEDILSQLYSPNGYIITETDFGSPVLDPSGNYTLTISSVADNSYELDLGYINQFENVLNPSEVVSAEPTPPDLLTDPSKGVLANPIYNKDAARYGAFEVKTLPEDAIIGYTLEATYDNVQRIGKTVTYYAYEYKTFFNALKNKDPLEAATPLMKMTHNIDNGSDKVPKVAVLFGGQYTGSSEYKNGYQVYYAGEANDAGGSLVNGMGRGFRYIFAYTVEYAGSSSDSEAVRTYPYDHKEYSLYNQQHGGVKENNVEIGKGVAYILNSGMCSAPRVMPDFHSYVFQSTPDSLASASATSATGEIELHYTWRDPDGLIVIDESDNNTKVSYPTGDGQNTVTENIQKEPLEGADKWYRVTVPYQVTKSDPKILTPQVNVSAYKIEYNEILKRFSLEEDSTSCPLSSVPVEWPWDEQFKHGAYNNIIVTMDTGHLDQNYIDFQLNSNDLGVTDLAKRAAAMKLKIQVLNNPGSEKTFYLPMVSDVSGIYARLATGRLGTEYLNKEFEVTEASILYDTGQQGWNIAENDEMFTLQYTNETGGDFGFSDYVGASGSASLPANGALLNNNNAFKIGNLRNTIQLDDPEQDTKVSFWVNPVLPNKSGSTTYLYPASMGVDAHHSSTAAQLSGRYLTAKRIGTHKLVFENGKDTGTLDAMTPTMTHTGFHSSTNTVEVTGLEVNGFENDGTIYMAAYANYDDAKQLNTQYGGTSPVTIQIGVGGKPVLIDEKMPAIEGLDARKKYYVAFWYKKGEDDVLLLRSDNAEPAIYEVTTSPDAVIDVTTIEYRNDSYFDKSMDIVFNISRTFNLSLRYDIFASREEAEKADGEPLLSHETMNAGTADILFEPEVIMTNNNKLKINLKPDLARQKLEPGKTYYLKISAQENNNGAAAGSTIEEFTITAIGNYGALIYVSKATRDSITYQVTINDPQYTFMTVDSEDGKTAGGLYTVRFTDDQGHLLNTTYDDKVYPMSAPRKVFVLDDDALINDKMNLKENAIMEAGKTYLLNIYAVPDDNHDGQITLNGDTNPSTWADFFDKQGSQIEDCGNKFIEIVKRFWTENTMPNPATAAVEKQLGVASKSQSTTTKDDWLLNENGIYATRQDSDTIRIVFEESFGLIKDDEPLFKRIDWSVYGKAADGTPVDVSGVQRRSQQDELLKKGKDSGGYPIYYFDLPYTVGQGRYTIVLQFRTAETEPAPTKSVTVRGGV